MPRQIYYPSMVVNLRLRFDEALHVAATSQPDPLSTDDMITERIADAAKLSRPLIMSGTADKLSRVVGRIPLSCSIELNGYRQAGTFDMTLDWRDMPLDPRAVRAVGVELYLGSLTPEDFARGVVKANADGSRSSVMDITNVPPLLVGVGDLTGVEHGEDGKSTVHISGRDLLGILLDAKVDPRIFEHLDLTKNIVNVVQQIVSLHPYGAHIVVDANADDWNALGPQEFGPSQPLQSPSGQFGPSSVMFSTNIPSPGSKDGITRVRRGADGQQSMSAPPGDGEKIAFWDLITRYCFLVGAVPYFVGEVLRIRPARSLYDYTKKAYDPRIPTPFKDGLPREILNGDPATREQIKIRRFVYGSNLKSLKFERKHAGTKAPTVQVVSINTGSSKRGYGGKLITGTWPSNIAHDPKKNKVIAKAKVTGVAPSGKASETDILRIPVAGLSSVDVATAIAQQIYEEIGRGEMGGSASTKDLASFGGDLLDPDNLALKPGDPVELLTDIRALSSRSPLVNVVVDAARRSYEDAVSDLTQRLGDENLARVIVATARGLIVELQTVFRVNNVKYAWTGAGGGSGALQIDFDFQNYVEARSDVGPSLGANQKAPSKSSTPKRQKVGGA